MSTRYRKLPIVHRQCLITKLKSVINLTTLQKIDTFIANNHNSILDLISYSSLLISEIIGKYPHFIKQYQKLKYRLNILLVNGGNDHTKQEEETSDVQLSQRQQDLIKLTRSIYGYIVDIRIAQGIFAIIPYITTFFKDYSSVTKLKNINTLTKFEKFIKFILFASYQFYETNGFLTSHDFIPSFKSFLLPRHRKDQSNLSTSDWFYIYSCRFWFVANIIDTGKNFYNGKVPSVNLLIDDILSLHWSLTDGLLTRDLFAMIGFVNNVFKFKKLL